MQKYYLLLLLPLIILSCKKSTNAPVPAPTLENYFPPKAGNYWVYEQFNEDSATGIFTDIGSPSDSIYYAGDTSLNGKTYHVFYDYNNGNASLANLYSLIWRDSSGYMVNQNAQIQLAIQNFTDTLQVDSSALLTVKYIMVNNVSLATPAGSYNTLEFKGIITSSANFVPGPQYYYSFYYALNVGLVMYHFFDPRTHPGGAFERRLLRYHLN